MADEFEVEVKFRLVDADRLQKHVRAFGSQFSEPVTQCDTYFAHPQRNFKETDEALRIRQIGEVSKLTYKGPKLDQATKTRRELEFPVLDPDKHEALFELLGFHAVGSVRKQRRTARIEFEGRQFEVCWDEVEGLGAFVELETTADQTQLENATASVLNLAEHMGLRESERRGYLDLLLDD